jgi:UDP-2,3-diacylglucosamine pyrophosphatase LpxH
VADIRYVVVSDLHFGAENSLLTSIVEDAAPLGFSADPRTPSPVLVGFLDGLRHLTGQQDRRPTLVLAGDVVDLALCPDEVSATVFGGFAELAFGDGGVFAPVVYYLPGNHDHHLWETAREDQYIRYVQTLPLTDDLAPPWHVTRIRPEDQSPAVGSAWMTSLIQRQPGCRGVEVRVVYPNMALVSSDGRRGVVVSHGHFTESIYTLMSQFKDVLYPDQREGLFTSDIALWEEENFAWIDFLWSTLGRSGEVGSDLGLVYADLSSPKDLDALVSNLTKALLAKGKGPKWMRPAERWALNSIFERETNRLARSERGTPDVTLSDKGKKGLRTYLEGPVLAQVRGEVGGLPDELTFVFGHTHKPFVDRWDVAGHARPVRIMNTGGWVVDSAAPAPTQGAVAVLVDDELEAVSLQLYRQSATATPVPVQLLPAAAGDDSALALRAQVTAALDPTAPPWAALTGAASRLIAQRHRMQAALVAQREVGRPERAGRRRR